MLLFLLIICNLAFPASNGWSRVAWSLIGYGGLFYVYRLAKLKPDDIGLTPKYIMKGLIYASWVILAIFICLILVYAVESSAFRDTRYHHTISSAIYSALLILPLKTVFFEELAFRGVFLGMLLQLKLSRWYAIIISSLAYGCWHISSAAILRDGSFSSHSLIYVAASVSGIVLVTTIAGILFSQLRLHSKSLAAPIAVHWFINGAATVLAAISWS